MNENIESKTKVTGEKKIVVTHHGHNFQDIAIRKVFNINNSILICNSIKFRGQEYHIGGAVVEKIDPTTKLPQFAVIDAIVRLDENSEWTFVLSKLKTICFDEERLKAYIAERSDQLTYKKKPINLFFYKPYDMEQHPDPENDQLVIFMHCFLIGMDYYNG